MKLKYFNIFFLFAVYFGASNLSYAAISTQNFSWDLSEVFTPSEPQKIVRQDNLAFELFDPSLGELNKISFLRNDLVTNVSVYATNSNSTPAWVNITYQIEYLANLTPGFSNPLMALISASTGVDLVTNQPFSLISGAGTDSDGSFLEEYKGMDMNPFIGVGLFDVNPRLNTNIYDIGLPLGTQFIIDTKFSGSYELTYDYTPFITPVPEPESYAMILMGLGLVGYVVRRRKNLYS